MNQKTCNPGWLDAFLESELNEIEELQFTQHLDECADCREELESHAAEQSAWQEVTDLLGGVGQRSTSVSGDHRTSTIRSPQIEQVLNQLAPTDDPEMLGRIGSYEVSGVVGAGGMGVVLKAHDRSLDRIVAIKVMSPHLASSGSARKRFAREAKAAAAVLHPNVIAIHGVASDVACPYLVMPYLRGASLQKRIDAQGPLPLKDTLRIGAQIASGLAAAHDQGLVHRDIKPANILLEEGVERVTITDFGLARAVDDASMTCSGVIAGTPQYMSPEQTRGEPIDARSDLFSLGSVLYAMCAGRSPFRAETTYGVLHRIANDNPTPIREVNSDVPAWLSHIIERLMSKRPDDRFDSAAQVAELLEGCLAHVQQPTTMPLPESIATLDDGNVLRKRKNSGWAQALRFVTPDGLRRTANNSRPPFGKFIAAAAITFSLIFAGVLIVLELNKGTLTIESNGDVDIPIRIMRGDEFVQQLTVTKDGAKTRLRAGEYIIEVDQDVDGYQLTGNQVTLNRGENWIARITQRRNDAKHLSDSIQVEERDNLSKAIQGFWMVYSFNDGFKLHPKELRPMQVQIDDDTMLITVNSALWESPIQLTWPEPGTSESPTNDPHPIDLTFVSIDTPKGAPEIYQGIIRCDGETLTICFAEAFRPKRFLQGSNVYYLTCRKANGAEAVSNDGKQAAGVSPKTTALPQTNAQNVIIDEQVEQKEENSKIEATEVPLGERPGVAELLETAAEHEAWVSKISSIHFRAKGKHVQSEKSIELERAKLIAMGANGRLPIKSSSLLPTFEFSEEVAWDGTTIANIRKYSLGLDDSHWVWDGKQFTSFQDGASAAYVLDDEDPIGLDTPLAGSCHWPFDPRYVLRTSPTDELNGFQVDAFTLHTPDRFHGVRCHRLVSVDQQIALFIDVDSGRMIGKREGILTLPIVQVLTSLGHDVKTAEEAQALFVGLAPKERAKLLPVPQQMIRKFIIDTLLNGPTAIETWVSDFRPTPLGIFPMKHDQRVSGEESGVIYERYHGELEVAELQLDESVVPTLFEIKFRDGVTVVDNRFETPITYSYDSRMTAADLQALVQKSLVSVNELEALVGKPLPALSNLNWINTETRDNASFHGRPLIIECWAVGCGPCRNHFATLNNVFEGGSIQVLGFHTADKDVKTITRFAQDLKLGYPIVVDTGDGSKNAFGPLPVSRMPYTILVDALGIIVGHGDLETLLSQASEIAAQEKPVGLKTATTPTLAEATAQFNQQSAQDRRTLFHPPIPELTEEQLREGFRKAALKHKEDGETDIAATLAKIAETGRMPEGVGRNLTATGFQTKDENGKMESRQIVPGLIVRRDDSSHRLVFLQSLSLRYSKDGESSRRWGSKSTDNSNAFSQQNNEEKGVGTSPE